MGFLKWWNSEGVVMAEAGCSPHVIAQAAWEVATRILPETIVPEKTRSMIILHEDLRLELYKCSSGKLTIGIGRNIEDRGISEDEAFYLFNNDIQITLHDLQKNFPWFSSLDEVRQAVLIDMCFNMGITRFKRFVKMLDHASRGEYIQAAEQMRKSKWYRQVKTRATRLVNMMASGNWSSDIK